MAAREKRGAIQRSAARPDHADRRKKPARDHRTAQPAVARLVGLLRRRARKPLHPTGPMAADETAEPPEKTGAPPRPGPRTRPSTLSQCLLRGTRVNLPERLDPGQASQPRMKGLQHDWRALTNWRAGGGKSARPVRREGRGHIPRPYLYRIVVGTGSTRSHFNP